MANATHAWGPQEPVITYLGITESDITESGGIWKLGNRYNGNVYIGINYNGKVESDITETGITESVITLIFESGIGYNRKMESTITESGIMESDITKKRNHA